MPNCKISIIIPTYNRGWCIENAIKSIIKENYYNYELIIIDDGSNDGTKEIVKKYLNRKIRYYYKENSGKLLSVNFAIDNLISKDSDILFILDSDDELFYGILKIIENEFLTDNNFLSYHFKGIIPKYINRYSELIEKDKDYIIGNYENLIQGKIYKGDFVGFINLHLLGDTRFEESCPNGLESIFWYRLSKKGNSKYINIPGIFIDSKRKKGEKKDNLTSYFSIYRRSKGMVNGLQILINENKNEIINLNKDILGKWYFELFNWCIIDKKFIVGFNAWRNSIIYSNGLKKIKFFCFGILFLIPKPLLPIVLKIYYIVK